MNNPVVWFEIYVEDMPGIALVQDTEGNCIGLHSMQ